MKQQDSTGMANEAKADCHEEAPAADEQITLSQAAKPAPGRPRRGPLVTATFRGCPATPVPWA